MGTKTKVIALDSRNPNNSISLRSTIELYEGLMKQGRIKKNSAGAQRLEQLKQKAFAYRKWIKTPYAKRRHITSPLERGI